MRTNEEVVAGLNRVLKDYGIDQYVADGKLSDFDLDSLDLLEMTMMLEDEFDVQVDDSVIAEWETMGDVVKTFVVA